MGNKAGIKIDDVKDQVIKIASEHLIGTIGIDLKEAERIIANSKDIIALINEILPFVEIATSKEVRENYKVRLDNIMRGDK